MTHADEILLVQKEIEPKSYEAPSPDALHELFWSQPLADVAERPPAPSRVAPPVQPRVRTRHVGGDDVPESVTGFWDRVDRIGFERASTSVYSASQLSTRTRPMSSYSTSVRYSTSALFTDKDVSS